MRFAKSALPVDEREEKAFEPGAGFVERSFQRIEEVDIQLLRLVNIFADSIKKDCSEEGLRDVGFGRNKDLGGFVAGVGGPNFGSRDGEEFFPLGKCGDDFEGFREFAGLVA